MTDLLIRPIPLPISRPEEADNWRIHEMITDLPDIWSQFSGYSPYAGVTTNDNSFDIVMFLVSMASLTIIGYGLIKFLKWIKK